jgi:hypothetical protein
MIAEMSASASEGDEITSDETAALFHKRKYSEVGWGGQFASVSRGTSRSSSANQLCTRCSFVLVGSLTLRKTRRR